MVGQTEPLDLSVKRLKWREFLTKLQQENSQDYEINF